MTTIAPPALPKPAAPMPIYYLIYLAFALVPATTCLTFCLRLVVPFKEIFKDFKTTLPAFTENMLGVADLVRDGGWIAIVLVTLAVPILPALITAKQPSRPTRFNLLFLTFNIIFLLNMIIAWLCAAALFLPLIKLVQSVSGGEPASGY